MLKSRIKRPRKAAPGGFSAAQIAQRCGFPVVASSTQFVAIIELGGGWSKTDVNAYCAKYGLTVPTITDISVDGATNSYTGDPNSADGEVALDIQNIIGATGGKVDILMFWCPNNDTGMADAINAVVKDGRACAISISWGSAESSWSATSRQLTSSAIAAAAAAGVPFFAASGDDGSADGTSANACDYPASDPNGIGCGGTTITASGEVAWSYGGGGFSHYYPAPKWQVGQTARGVPDVALDADPDSGYQIVIGGQWAVFGGTSAVAPMWAALTALLVTQIGQKIFGFAQKIYALGDSSPSGLTDIISGSNGAYHAAVGWDACTGEGVPNAAFCAAMVGAVVTVPAPSPVPTPPPVPISGFWQKFILRIEALLKRFGPAALPIIEYWLSMYAGSIPPPVMAIIQQLLNQYLGQHISAISARTFSWSGLLSEVGVLIREYGVYAVPLVEHLIEALNLPAPVQQAIDAMIEEVLDKPLTK